MDAATDTLPDDLNQLKALIAEQQATIDQLQRVNEGLTHRLDVALRRIYG